MIELYRPDVLRGLRRKMRRKRSNVIVNEFLESGNNYDELTFESCGCRPLTKMTNINRYTWNYDIPVKVIIVNGDCYIVRIDGNEKEYRKEISELYQ